ncbi:Gametolysin peptidase M11 [Fragilaria crotonensis]|nr:Gametolysin peptidase M11 [Fragilaria crotonensis]
MVRGLAVLLVVAHLCGAFAADDSEIILTRGRELQQRQLRQKIGRRSVRPCVVVLIEKQYEDHRQIDQPLGCELQGDDLNGKQYKMVRVNGLTSSWAKNNNVTSGATTLFALDGADIDDDTDELIVPPGATFKLGRHRENTRARRVKSAIDATDLPWRRNLLKIGTRSVLVIRIIAKDSATPATESELADDIFGASGDKYNLKSAISQCSGGQLRFEPITNITGVGTDGVYTVSIPSVIVNGNNDGVVSNAALDQAAKDLGAHPRLLADHVMLCIPPGTVGSWISSAPPNHWMSSYNGKWCRFPSAHIHELGHNMNLHHSGEGSDEYGDESGHMGYSYEQDDGPVKCYNGAKTWQLGWYTDFHVDLPVGDSYNWNGHLVGFAQKDSASSTDKMIIRIRSTQDYYIHFNRQIGMNSGTQEGGDKVLVTSRDRGTGLAASKLLAKLSKNGVYTISAFNGSNQSLKIVVSSINLGTLPARASVSVQFALSAPPFVQPTVEPTAAPTREPTAAPTREPTRKPTRRPTRKPTTKPKAPTRSPTSAPTIQPLSAPVLPLSSAPSISITPSLYPSTEI